MSVLFGHEGVDRRLSFTNEWREGSAAQALLLAGSLHMKAPDETGFNTGVNCKIAAHGGVTRNRG